MDRYPLAGKVALVTGGARGIGLATARAFAARGASVLVVDLDQQQADAAAAQVHDIRAAGLATPLSTVRRLPGETFERVLDVNLGGVYRTVDAALEPIVGRRGQIVLISSVYAFLNGVGETPYAMSKAAVEQLGRALRVELAQHGVGVTVAYFGFIDTEMVRGTLDGDALAQRMLATFPSPLRRRLAPSVAGEAIARAVERRSPRVVRPRRWAVLSALRGVTEPLNDARLLRDAQARRLIAELDAREPR